MKFWKRWRSRRRANDAVLFRAHAHTPASERELKRLAGELGGAYDVWLVGYCLTSGQLDEFHYDRTLAYQQADLVALAYPGKFADVDWQNPVGHNDLPVMKFFQDHPGYERFWIVEYDVRFSGPWSTLFSDLASSSADILSTTVQTYTENPAWHHWAFIRTGEDTVPLGRMVKGFMPFSRLSRAALAAIHERYRAGWSGHYEGTWATIASLRGLAIEDIGGSGSFVPPRRRGMYYSNASLDPDLSPGTFVYRPPFAEEELSASSPMAMEIARISPGVLWHPVKS